MSLILSTPGGTRMIGARTLVLTTIAWCLAPALIGGIGWLALDLTAGSAPPQQHSAWQMLMQLMLLSPIISAPFWLAVGIGTALFCRRGWYGSLSALAWGALFGAACALAAGAPSLIATGAIMATFHRFSLAVLRPDAF